MHGPNTDQCVVCICRDVYQSSVGCKKLVWRSTHSISPSPTSQKSCMKPRLMTTYHMHVFLLICQGLSAQFKISFLSLFANNQLFGGCARACVSVKVFSQIGGVWIAKLLPAGSPLISLSCPGAAACSHASQPRLA